MRMVRGFRCSFEPPPASGTMWQAAGRTWLGTCAAGLQCSKDIGVLELRPYQDRPMRHEHLLTVKGPDLYPVVVALLVWGGKWMAVEAGSHARWIHRRGHAPRAEPACAHCRQTLLPTDVATS